MLAGRYVLGERLGGGGLGVVYAAHDEKLDRRVALKLLRPDAGGSEEAHHQLVREAQTLARLAHPNVVNVHAIGDLQGQVYVEMELVVGTTLGQWLRAGERTWQDVLATFLQAGAGLAAAHAVGIVHRDFKPDNVLVGDDGRVRVADFGIALLGPRPASGRRTPKNDAGLVTLPETRDDEESETTRSHSRVIAGSGTPGYMAPEQRAGLDVSARSDQYTFCVALFEALHGVRPREAKLGIRGEEDLAPPAWLDAAIERGLSFKAADRFPSMEALLGVLASEPRRRIRRRRTFFAAAAAVALLGAGVASGSAARSQRLCRGSEEKLAGVWDAGRKSAVERAFRGSGKPFAPDAWHGVEKTLDAYAHDWTRTRTEACEATRVRGEQSDQVLGLRMACLDERLDAMGALTDAFTRADEKVVTKAFEATQALPALAACSDPERLRRAAEAAPDPQLASQRAELRTGMARAKALDDLGKYREALPLAREHSAEAARLGDQGLQAEALYREGKLLGRTGDLAGAEQNLRRAAALADAAGDDALRVRAISGLLFFVAGDAMKVDQLAGLEEQAKGALARLGGDEEVEGNFLMGLGNALEAAGKNAEALEVDERVMALEARLHGPDSWQAGVVLVNLGNTLANPGETARAIETEERAVAIVARDLGPSHPSVADAEATIGISLYGQDHAALGEPHMRRAVAITDGQVGAEEFVAYLYGLGDILLAQGRHDEALEQFQRAYDLLAEHHPARDPLLRTALTGIGDVKVSQGRSAEAAPYLERALALPPDGDQSTEARAKFALARALAANGPNARSRARTLATEAKATLDQGAQVPGDAARLRAIDEWLLQTL
jgi:tetratricopeptide (TPR) repeat protein